MFEGRRTKGPAGQDGYSDQVLGNDNFGNLSPFYTHESHTREYA